MSIYKACDIRGRYGEELRDQTAIRLGYAIAHYCGEIDILVGGDGRLSTPVLKDHLVMALSTAGCRVTDVGTVPTPALYFARRHTGIDAAVMVTASHNPPSDNGFKLTLGPEPIKPEHIEALAGLMEGNSQLITHSPQPVLHIDILPDYATFAQSQTSDLSGMKVIVDCANGVGGLAGHQIWQATGAQVSYLFDTPDGRFPNHAPDPSDVRNLQALCKAVEDHGADLGVAYDGDADRVVFVDSHGRPLSGDRAIVIFLRHALRAGPAPIVYDQKCSLIVPDAIRKMGGQPVVERSGHTFIKSTFLRLNAPYAGEISGHHFFGLLGGDDGIIASLYMANLVRSSGETLASIADSIHTNPITPDIRLQMDEGTSRRVLGQLTEALAGEATLTTLDGLRADFTDGWGMARQSVTQAALTLRFEGTDQQSLDRIMRRFEHAAPELIGKLTIPATDHETD